MTLKQLKKLRVGAKINKPGSGIWTIESNNNEEACIVHTHGWAWYVIYEKWSDEKWGAWFKGAKRV